MELSNEFTVPLPPDRAWGVLADLERIGGGRPGNPTGPETLRFLHEARGAGAVGVAFWVWQDTTAEQWQAISRYPW